MLYLPQDHTPSAVFYHTTQAYGAFTDFLVLHGRTDYFDQIRCFQCWCSARYAYVRMDSQSDADKQTDSVVSPSLLQWEIKDVRDFYDPNFDFMQDSERLPPLTKRKKLSLSLNKGKRKTEDLEGALYDSTNTVATDNTLPTSSRFGSPTSEEQLGDAAKGVIPNNILCNTGWAENNFQAWAVERNRLCPEDPVPLDLLQSHDAKLVCKNLCRFVMETQREDGKPYPPASLRCLLSALNRILQDNNAPFSVFDN